MDEILKPNQTLDSLIHQWNETRSSTRRWPQERSSFFTDLSPRSMFDEAARYILNYTDPEDVVLEVQSKQGESIISGLLCGKRRFIERFEYSIDKAGVISRDIAFPKSHSIYHNSYESNSRDRIPEPFSYVGERRVIVTDDSPLAVLRAHSYTHQIPSELLIKEAESICERLRTNHSQPTLHIPVDPNFMEEDFPVLMALCDEIAKSAYCTNLIVPFSNTATICSSHRYKDAEKKENPISVFLSEVKNEWEYQPIFNGNAAVSCNAPDQIPCSDNQIDYAIYRLPNPSFLSERHLEKNDKMFAEWFDLTRYQTTDTFTRISVFRELFRVLKPGKWLTVISRERNSISNINGLPLHEDPIAKDLREIGFEVVPHERQDPPRKGWVVYEKLPLKVITARKHAP